MAYRVPVLSCQLVRDRTVPASVASLVDSPERAAALARAVIGPCPDREHFGVILLDARNKAVGVNVVSVGTLTASLVHPREVFKPAVLASAAGLVLFHNHPSGDPGPSPEDREATRRIVRAGALLGIPVLDHVIVTEDAHYSFKEFGILGDA